MWGRFVLIFSFAALLLMAALTISCGSSSGTQPCTGGPYNAVGNWQMTVTDAGGAGSLTMYGAIDAAGLALFFDNSTSAGTGDSAQLPAISGSCSFSGNITAYAEPGGPDSGSVVTDSSQGNVTSNSALKGTFSGSASGTFSATAFSPLTGSATALSGGRTGSVQGALNGQAVLLPLTFTPAGSNNSMTFTTNQVLSQNCSVTGTLTQLGTNNVFDVSITFAGTSCAITGTFSGIGFESGTDYFDINGGNQETYLYADILDSGNTFVMEIF
jgi:hypothetical protein